MDGGGERTPEPGRRTDEGVKHDMDLRLEHARAITRRTFSRQAGLGLGAIALGSLRERDAIAAPIGLNTQHPTPNT